jgi:hypothetical protein
MPFCRRVGIPWASVVLVALATVSGAARVARAECPVSGSPDLSVCRYYAAVLVPSVEARAYFPGSGGGGSWFGGGVQLVLFAWSDNSQHFGPGQGKIRIDAAVLGSDTDGAGKLVVFDGGATVSFERNASRSWLIPYFGFDVGGMHESHLGGHGFVEGLLGVHAMYTRRVILDLEGGYLFPFDDADRLAGPRTQLTLSFSLW